METTKINEKQKISKPFPAFKDENIKRDHAYVVKIMEGDDAGQLRTVKWELYTFLDDYDRKYLLGQVEIVREL